MCYLGEGGALVAPDEHLLLYVFCALEACFDTSVGEIAHPAGEAELEGFTVGGLSVAYALDASSDEEV